MSAIVKACNKILSLKNTGSECHDSMGPTVMLFIVPPGTVWTQTQLNDFTATLAAGIIAAKTARIYPMFGPVIPIRKITLSKESDVIPVMDDGTPIFVRYGSTTKVYATTEGGICFAKAIQSFVKCGYSIVEVDNTWQVLIRDNGDGTFGPLKTTFMFSPSPDAADFKNPGFTNFQISYRPEEFVGNGAIYQGDDTITDLFGLIDAVAVDAGSSSTTLLKFGVETACGDTDLVAEFGASIAPNTLYVVTNQATGVVAATTAGAIVSGHVQLTGTFVSGQKYVVTATAALLDAATVNGFEVIGGVVTIP